MSSYLSLHAIFVSTAVSRKQAQGTLSCATSPSGPLSHQPASTTPLGLPLSNFSTASTMRALLLVVFCNTQAELCMQIELEVHHIAVCDPHAWSFAAQNFLTFEQRLFVLCRRPRDVARPKWNQHWDHTSHIARTSQSQPRFHTADCKRGVFALVPSKELG